MLFDRENFKSYYIHTLWRRDASEEENCDYMMHSHTFDDSRDITQYAVIGILLISNIFTFIVCRATVALDMPRRASRDAQRWRLPLHTIAARKHRRTKTLLRGEYFAMHFMLFPMYPFRRVKRSFREHYVSEFWFPAFLPTI